MSNLLRRVIRETLSSAGLTLMSNGRYERLERRSRDLERINAAIDFIRHCPAQQSGALLRLARESKAQLFQDLFVLSELSFKSGGYFVEFGATNGMDLSNTFLMEKQFGWSGILAEPGKAWHNALKRNRHCQIETACVWNESNLELNFNATDIGELGTIDAFSSSDLHAQRRLAGEKYSVKTISLVDLFDKYHAPPVIDYLSIDTEGSEYEILRCFDFNKYRFRVITCEHNFTPSRDALLSLLTRNGYERKFEGLSDFDDWYVSSELTSGHWVMI